RAVKSARVEELELATAPEDRPSQRIAGGSRDRRDNRTPTAGHAVEQRGLPNVGPADESDRGRCSRHNADGAPKVTLSLGIDSVSSTRYRSYQNSGDPKHDQGRHR